jgi:hypothetical protein
VTAPEETFVVGLIADEGLPHLVAEHLAKRLPGVLSAKVNPRVDWTVHAASKALTLDDEGRIPMFDIAARYRSDDDADMVVLLTDLPRRAGVHPIMSDLNSERGVALASLPALGAIRVRKRAEDLVVHLVGHLVEGRLGAGQQDTQRDVRRDGASRILAPTRHIDSEDDRIDLHLGLTGVRGRARLLAGMVRGNQPWRLSIRLVKVLAAAFATSALSIATSTIWLIAADLAIWRLIVAGIASVFVLVFWLIVFHGLWERPSRRANAEEAAIFNAATVITLFLGVLTLYVALYVIDLVATWFVVPYPALAYYSRLPKVTFANVAILAWLVASASLVAGAVGSGLESVSAVRRAAYSKREAERRSRHSRSGEDGEDDGDDDDGQR